MCVCVCVKVYCCREAEELCCACAPSLVERNWNELVWGRRYCMCVGKIGFRFNQERERVSIIDLCLSGLFLSSLGSLWVRCQRENCTTPTGRNPHGRSRMMSGFQPMCLRRTVTTIVLWPSFSRCFVSVGKQFWQRFSFLFNRIRFRVKLIDDLCFIFFR